MRTSTLPDRGCVPNPITHSSRRLQQTALHATAAPSRYAAEETARKAAAVREQLKQHSSKLARQLHEQNVHIAELHQAAAAKRAQQLQQQQQEQQQRDALAEQQQWLEQQQQQQQHQEPLHTLPDSDFEQLLQQQQYPSVQQRQQLFRGDALPQTHLDRQQQQQQQQRQPALQQQQQLAQDQFYSLLQEIEVMARSSDYLNWQSAARQCRQVLVPSVSGPLQAEAAWQLMTGLAGRQLSRGSQGALGSAVAALVQVSLAHKDFTMLQHLLSSPRRFAVGPRQLRDLATVAAAAGAGSDMLTALLELAPACQLSSRAYFVVAATCINRRHFQEAAKCLQRLQDLGVGLSPGLRRLQQQAKGGMKPGGRVWAVERCILC